LMSHCSAAGNSGLNFSRMLFKASIIFSLTALCNYTSKITLSLFQSGEEGFNHSCFIWQYSLMVKGNRLLSVEIPATPFTCQLCLTLGSYLVFPCLFSHMRSGWVIINIAPAS
jgi:hypothetical protein